MWNLVEYVELRGFLVECWWNSGGRFPSLQLQNASCTGDKCWAKYDRPPWKRRGERGLKMTPSTCFWFSFFERENIRRKTGATATEL
jgi:hypothetical protein